MKRIALATLLFCSPLLAAEKPTTPASGLNGTGEGYCIKVKDLGDRTACFSGGVVSDQPLDFFKDSVKNSVAGLGFDAANSYWMPEKYRDVGRQIIAGAPYLAFPELGDPITKDTPAVAYCSSSVGNDVLDPFNAQTVKATGKGRCQDMMTIYLRPAGK